MTGSVRCIAGHDGVVALALPARRQSRTLLVPEVLPDRQRRRFVAEDDADVPEVWPAARGEAYGAPAPRPGLLLDLYV